MRQIDVKHLERRLEDVIEAALQDGWSGPQPSLQILHLMAKAAVTVLEASIAQAPEQRRRTDDR